MTKDDWNNLATRCSNSPGPDEDINIAIFEGCPSGPSWEDKDGRKYPRERYTASLDAIISLIEDQFPIKHGNIVWMEMCVPMCSASIATDGDTMYTSDAVFPELALCAVFCRAMAEKVA